MKVNEGNADRISRIVGGVLLLSLVFIGPETLFGLIGLIPITTGLAGRCPLYSIFGISTCHHKEA